MTVLALGPLEVRCSGRPVDLGPPKQRATFGVLADAAPDPVSVDRLVDQLWPERPPRDPLRSIQVYVSSLRRAVGSDALVTVGRAYRLEVAPERIDTVRFWTGATDVRALLEFGRAEDACELAADLLDRWRGEAWQGMRDVPALALAADRLAERRLDVVADSIAARLALGRHGELVPELEDLVRRHPLREDLVGHLVLALHRRGRQADALAAYAGLRTRKVEETGLEPGAELRDLQARVLADDPTLVVEAAELRARRHLPAQLTRLVGRRREVDQLVGLLRDGDCRMVTLTGPGGIGKTRVALQVAHELAASFPDGVWFVGLADLTDPALVSQTIASALDVDPAGDDFTGPLHEWLRSRRALLLVDNFEQVDEAAPLLAALLGAGPDNGILVTSRTRLRLYGERVWALDPLEPRDAGALFVERACGADRRFDGSDEAAIDRVCEALDRIPLAVELVAARVDEVPLADMIGQLETRLDLATAGPRDRSARQQTLRQAIGWSVDLLGPDVAETFGRLGVFVGGFEPGAADAVAGADGAQLATLVNASLVKVEQGGRHRMLETIREYALEVGAHHLPQCREAHARWFLEVAEAGVEGMRGESRAEWMARLERERGNMRAALHHLDAGNGEAAETMLRLATSLGVFWYRTCPAIEDVDWIDRALARAPAAEPLLRGRALHALAICRGEQGWAEEALEHCRESYRLLRDTEDEAGKARALNSLGGLTRDLGRAEEAVPIMDESIAVRRRLRDPSLPVTIALGNRSMAALDLGDLTTARRCLLECLELPDVDEVERAQVRVGLADVEIEAGELTEATELLRLAVPVLRRTEQRYRLVESLDTFAALAARRDMLREAAVLVAAADQILAEDGAVQVPADVRLRERRVGAALAGLPPDVRDEAARTGRVLSLDEALDLAVDRFL